MARTDLCLAFDAFLTPNRPQCLILQQAWGQRTVSPSSRRNLQRGTLILHLWSFCKFHPILLPTCRREACCITGMRNYFIYLGVGISQSLFEHFWVFHHNISRQIDLSSSQIQQNFCWELVLDDIPLVILYTKLITSFHLCMLQGCVRILMKSNLFYFNKGHNKFSTSCHAKMRLNQYRIFVIKPPEYPQACTENLSNVGGVLCKTSNSLPLNPIEMTVSIAFPSFSYIKGLGSFSCPKNLHAPYPFNIINHWRIRVTDTGFH